MVPRLPVHARHSMPSSHHSGQPHPHREHHCTELASARATSLQGRLVWLGLLLLPNDTCAFSLISHGSAQAGPAPIHTLPQARTLHSDADASRPGSKRGETLTSDARPDCVVADLTLAPLYNGPAAENVRPCVSSPAPYARQAAAPCPPAVVRRPSSCPSPPTQPIRHDDGPSTAAPTATRGRASGSTRGGAAAPCSCSTLHRSTRGWRQASTRCGAAAGHK